MIKLAIVAIIFFMVGAAFPQFSPLKMIGVGGGG